MIYPQGERGVGATRVYDGELTFFWGGRCHSQGKTPMESDVYQKTPSYASFQHCLLVSKRFYFPLFPLGSTCRPVGLPCRQFVILGPVTGERRVPRLRGQCLPNHVAKDCTHFSSSSPREFSAGSKAGSEAPITTRKQQHPRAFIKRSQVAGPGPGTSQVPAGPLLPAPVYAYQCEPTRYCSRDCVKEWFMHLRSLNPRSTLMREAC